MTETDIACLVRCTPRRAWQINLHANGDDNPLFPDKVTGIISAWLRLQNGRLAGRPRA